ncbi:hypothetical protein AB0D08_18910, partial [Kitasatospora sp. NPDC048540]
MERHRLSVLFCDRPRAVARITCLLARRGYALSDFGVEVTQSAGIRRATFIVELDRVDPRQVAAQLEKQVDVIQVDLLPADGPVSGPPGTSQGSAVPAVGADPAQGQPVRATCRPTPVTAATVLQQPSGMPFHRYVPFGSVDLP